MPGRSARWIWAGRLVFLGLTGGLAAYLWRVGLDQADRTASIAGVVLALLALGAPYLLPPGAATPPASAAPTVDAAGLGSVAVGGHNDGQISTDVSGVAAAAGTEPPPGGVAARGPGAVAIGGSNRGSVHTKANTTDAGDARS